MAVVLTDRGEFEVAATSGLRVSPADAEAITGWTLIALIRGTPAVRSTTLIASGGSWESGR